MARCGQRSCFPGCRRSPFVPVAGGDQYIDKKPFSIAIHLDDKLSPSTENPFKYQHRTPIRNTPGQDATCTRARIQNASPLGGCAHRPQPQAGQVREVLPDRAPSAELDFPMPESGCARCQKRSGSREEERKARPYAILVAVERRPSSDTLVVAPSHAARLGMRTREMPRAIRPQLRLDGKRTRG